MKLVFSQMRKNALEAWTRALDAQATRSHAWLGRAAEAEAQGELAAHVVVDEWARLMKDTLRFQLELSSACRAQSMAAIEKLLAMGGRVGERASSPGTGAPGRG